MQKQQITALLGAILLLSGPNTLFAQQAVEDALSAQNASLQTSKDVQERIDTLDDETRDLLFSFRSTLSQVEDLNAYNDQLEQLVATQRVEVADFENLMSTKSRVSYENIIRTWQPTPGSTRSMDTNAYLACCIARKHSISSESGSGGQSQRYCSTALRPLR